MSQQVNLSTTGSPAVVVINDLGAITFNHPIVSFPLLINDGPYLPEELSESVDLQAAVTAGSITLTDEQGNTITNVSQQINNDSLVKISIDDTTSGYLNDKIVGTGNVTFTILNPGADEQIQLNVNPANPIDAADIGFDDTAAGLGATNVQDAIEALDTGVDTNTTSITNINNSLGQPNGIATLDASGFIPNSQLPDLAISNITVVADITARDALGFGANDEGDTVIVTDAGDDPNVPAGEAATYIWDGTQFFRLIDGGKVYSVNGAEGVVVLGAADIGYDNATSGLAATDVQGAIDELDSTIDGLATSSHAAATSGDDAIGVTPGQVITLELDTTTGGGDNAASITAGEGLYVPPSDNSDYMHFGLRNNQNATTFLRLSGNGDFSNLTGFRFPYDIEIIAVTAFNRDGDTDGWDGRIYVEGVVQPTLDVTVAATTSETLLTYGTPLTVTAGDAISAQFVLTAAAISRPQIQLFYNRV